MIRYFLDGKSIGTAESNEAFKPRLREMVLRGKIAANRLGDIQAQRETLLSMRSERGPQNEQKPAASRLTAIDGTELPINSDAIPYGSQSGKTHATEVLWKEWYKTIDGGNMVVVRDKGYNDTIVEWHDVTNTEAGQHKCSSQCGER